MSKDGSVGILPGDIKVLDSEWGRNGLAGHLELNKTVYRFIAERVLASIELTLAGNNLPLLLDSEGKVIPWSRDESGREDAQTAAYAQVEPGIYALWDTESGAASLKGISVSRDGQVTMGTFYHVFSRSALITHTERELMKDLPQAWLSAINDFITPGKRKPS